MQRGANFEVIHPPNTLAAKVPKYGGPDLKTIVREAEQALEALQESYLTWIRQDLEALAAAVARLRDTTAPGANALDSVYRIGQDIKGQGATFEFPLLTLIADSMCRLIALDVDPGERLKLIELHADALNIVVRDNIQGAGGAEGKKLIGMLRTAVDKVSAG